MFHKCGFFLLKPSQSSSTSVSRSEPVTTSEKRSQRRYQTERIARRRLMSLPLLAQDQPIGRFKKWNLSCDCAMCRLTKRGNIETQRMKDQRRNLSPGG